VIVDLEQGTVYLMNPLHGIDAVKLSSGQLLWSTAHAAKPLLLDGNLLIAQAEVPGRENLLRIVELNTTNPSQPLLAVDVNLPDGVLAAIEEGLGTSFQVSARKQQDALIVAWSFLRQTISGVSPTLGGPGDYTTNGAARIHLGTGVVSLLGFDEASTLPKPVFPDSVVELLKTGRLRSQPWRAGALVVSVEPIEGSENLALKRWHAETGEPLLYDIPLFVNGFTFRYASVDGRHLLGSKLESNGPGWIWSIYSTETGFLGEVRRSSPAERFFVWDSILFHESPPTATFVNGIWIEEPLTINAINLQTAAQLWTRQVRNTAYRGPHPPGDDRVPGAPTIPTAPVAPGLR
jgi:hypothetical protein